MAPVDKLSVVMAMAFGTLFLHERLTAREGIVGFFIAAGALILAWKCAKSGGINSVRTRFLASLKPEKFEIESLLSFLP